MNSNVVFVILSTTLLLAPFTMFTTYADVIPPKQQSKIGIANEDIVCDSGLFKVIRAGSNSVACVKPTHVAKLVNQGWAQDVIDSLLQDSLKRASLSAGKINIIEKIPIKTNIGKLASGAPVSSYDLIFEVCAITPIYAPDVLITSDSQTKQYELAETIESDSCVISATNIKASKSDSIKVTLKNKGDISAKVLGLQNELDSLKEQLSISRQALKDPMGPDAQKQGQKIVDLRKQINDKRDDLYRLLYSIHALTTDKQKLERYTFTGNVIEGASSSLLSVKESIQTSGLYDAIFEACAGPTTIKLPVITVTSDKQTIPVKLGEKISANSCQMTSVKIEADDQASITVAPAGNADSSKKATDLEVLVGSLQSELTTEKGYLKSLIHDSDRPENFAEQLDKHVVKITELREQITTAKAELNEILYRTYR